MFRNTSDMLHCAVALSVHLINYDGNLLHTYCQTGISRTTPCLHACRGTITQCNAITADMWTNRVTETIASH